MLVQNFKIYSSHELYKKYDDLRWKRLSLVDILVSFKGYKSKNVFQAIKHTTVISFSSLVNWRSKTINTQQCFNDPPE